MARSIKSMPRPARSPTSRLQEGEQLVGSGPVAAGDTVRWIIGDTESGAGADQEGPYPGQADPAGSRHQSRHQHRPAHLSPGAALDREDLHGLGLLALPAGPAHRAPPAECAADAAAPVETGLDIATLNFRYAIEGDNPPWRPLRAFDDGHKVYIEFPRGIGQGEMPPLFVIGPAGGSDSSTTVSAATTMIVDRLFAAAELRLGDKDSERRVRIVRTDGRPRS